MSVAGGRGEGEGIEFGFFFELLGGVEEGCWYSIGSIYLASEWDRAGKWN